MGSACGFRLCLGFGYRPRLMPGQAVLLPSCSSEALCLSPKIPLYCPMDGAYLVCGRRRPIVHKGSETMNFCKKFGRLGVVCALSVVGVTMGVNGAAALDYPTKPVRWIVGYPAGGSTDILARLIGQWLSARLGQQFIIENRPGAGNNLGTEQVVRAAPDGYTILLVNPANAINTTLYEKLSFNFVRDIVPVAGLIRVPNVMEVNPSVPAKTVPEFIAYAKANSGKINMASSGNGTSIHMSGELFKMMTGL